MGRIVRGGRLIRGPGHVLGQAAISSGRGRPNPSRAVPDRVPGAGVGGPGDRPARSGRAALRRAGRQHQPVGEHHAGRGLHHLLGGAPGGVGAGGRRVAAPQPVHHHRRRIVPGVGPRPQPAPSRLRPGRRKPLVGHCRSIRLRLARARLPRQHRHPGARCVPGRLHGRIAGGRGSLRPGLAARRRRFRRAVHQAVCHGATPPRGRRPEAEGAAGRPGHPPHQAGLGGLHPGGARLHDLRRLHP